jgi:putative hydrolase of the HAD superfamily
LQLDFNKIAAIENYKNCDTLDDVFRNLPSSASWNTPCYTCDAMNAAKRILIFDLDDTLVVEEASAEAALIETGELAQVKYGIDPCELQAAIRKTCKELWYGFPSHPYCRRVGISSWEGLWAQFIGRDPELKPLHDWAPTYRCESWRIALGSHGIDDPALAAELAETFPKLRRGKHMVFEDTVRTLERFSRSHSLGLLSNGAPDIQRIKIEGARISGYFRHILISGDVGFGKPDRRILEMLLARLNSRPEAALMIGNSLATDVQCAQNAGVQAVWVNRSGRQRDDGVVPDWEIAGLDELGSILSAAS